MQKSTKKLSQRRKGAELTELLFGIFSLYYRDYRYIQE